jgi:acetamidase/formamidase
VATGLIRATLYLPVFQPGAQFYTGDSHSVQGDGEVSGTAIEHSLSGVFRFVLQEGKTTGGRGPKTATTTFDGHRSRSESSRARATEVIKFLVEEKGLTEAKAFSLPASVWILPFPK